MNEILVNAFTVFIQITLITYLYKRINIYQQERYYNNYILFILLSSCAILFFLKNLLLKEIIIDVLSLGGVYLIAKFTFRKSYKEILYDFLVIYSILYSILYVIQTIMLINYKLLYPQYLDYLNAVGNIENIVIINSILFILVVSYTKINNYTTLLIKYRAALERTPVSVFFLMVYFLIIQIIYDTIPEIFYAYLYVFLAFIWFPFFINILMLKKSIDVIEQRKLIQTYQEYYPIISRMVSETKRKQHEHKNQLNVISAMLKHNKENNGDIKKYIETIRNTTDICFLLELENKIMAGLLYSKIYEANDRSIDFSYNLLETSSLPLKDYQIVEVIGNLIDNSFDSVSIIKNSTKKVILEIGLDKEYYFIRIKNNGPKIDPKNITKIFECGYSTKGANRGYGLYNVKTIIKQINGEIIVGHEDDYTVFEILINKTNS